MEWMMPTNRRKVLAIALVIVSAASHDAQAQDVQRVDVRDPGLVGHFYAASGASGRTGVLMLGGSGGGYPDEAAARDRKSTRLNSSHSQISYAVFCLKKKKTQRHPSVARACPVCRLDSGHPGLTSLCSVRLTPLLRPPGSSDF